MERFNETYRLWQPMKYATAKKKEVLDAALVSDEYGIELKVDGSSYVWSKDLDGSVHLYGDKISKKTGEVIDKIDNMPHMKAFAEEFFPLGSQLCVEIWSKYNWTAGKWEEHSSSKFVNSIMLCTPAKAAKRQEEIGPCGAYVFDVLYWGGKAYYSADFIDRYQFLKELEEETDFQTYPWLSFAQLIVKEKQEVIAEWLSEGYEGGVLKLLRSNGKVSAKHAVSNIGETAKRPMHTTYKIKQVDTVDVVIMGINLPTKEYTGKDPENYPYRDEEGNPVNRLWLQNMANGFDIGLYRDGELVKIGTVASGLDDEMRTEARQNPEYYIGTVIEVDCMSVDQAGHSLRHPRLMKLREDKAPEKCLWSDVFND